MRFTERLKSLGCVSYAEYLNSTHWTLFRKKFKASGHPTTCAVCGSNDTQLHHCSYDRIGHESLNDVVPLCQAHHEEVHSWLKARDRSVGCTHRAISAIKGQHWVPPFPKTKMSRRDRDRAEKNEARKALIKATKGVILKTGGKASLAHEEAKNAAAASLEAYRKSQRR